MIRQRASSGSPMEPRIGMSRAVRAGPFVAIAGTAPIAPDGGVAAPGDVAGQMRRCVEISLAALADLGGRPSDVIRTRVMLVDIATWEDAARVHGEVFGDVRPACTFVEVSGFVDPGWLVETEIDAFIEDSSS